MQYTFMQSHDYMLAFIAHSWPYIVTRTTKSRRAIMLALLLISRPTTVRNEYVGGLEGDDNLVGPFLVAHASQADLARVAGVSQQVVKQAIPDLEEADLITIIPGVGAANQYIL